MSDGVLAWWFAPLDRRLGFGDGRPVVVGETLTVEEPPLLCRSGLHASREAVDALMFAPSPLVCRVLLSGQIVDGADKVAASARTVLSLACARAAIEWWTEWVAARPVPPWTEALPALRWSDLDPDNLALRRNAIGLRWRRRWTPSARYRIRAAQSVTSDGWDGDRIADERQTEADMLTRQLTATLGGA